MLEIRNVSKCFGKHQVLDGVSLKCKSGKIYGITGYNGSGKTVLFKSICGFLELDEGGIYVEGKLKKNGEMLENAGIIIEGPAYVKEQSAYKNLNYLYSIRNKRDKKLIHKILEKVGLDPASSKHVGQFSMGMKQRLAIAQAIMENPKVLIMDEPMNGLDKRGVEEMRQLFLELKEQGKTMLLASHNKEDIDILCDEVYEMEDGRIIRIR